MGPLAHIRSVSCASSGFPLSPVECFFRAVCNWIAFNPSLRFKESCYIWLCVCRLSSAGSLIAGARVTLTLSIYSTAYLSSETLLTLMLFRLCCTSEWKRSFLGFACMLNDYFFKKSTTGVMDVVRMTHVLSSLVKPYKTQSCKISWRFLPVNYPESLMQVLQLSLCLRPDLTWPSHTDTASGNERLS